MLKLAEFRPWAAVAALLVPALVTGVLLGGWAGGTIFGATAPITPQLTERPVATEFPFPILIPATGTPQVTSSPAVSESPSTVQPGAAAIPLPAAPTAVTIATVKENSTALEVTVRWNAGSGNGKPVTGHRVTIRSDRGYSASWEAGTGGDGGSHTVPCGSQKCDGIRVETEVRAVTSAGQGAVGRGGLTYSAPYLVRRELRSDQGASTPAKAQENATESLRGLRSSILTAGVACTDWNERVISVWAAPDGSWWIFAGIVDGLCKY